MKDADLFLNLKLFGIASTVYSVEVECKRTDRFSVLTDFKQK